MTAGWWHRFFDRKVAGLILADLREHELDFLCRELQLKPGCRLFDQCCGWGRVAGPLAARGITVYGVDSSPQLIQAARQRWTGGAHFYHAEASTYRQSPLCHAACNLYSSFGYSDDHDYNQSILDSLVASVQPPGRVLLDTINPHRVYHQFQPLFTTALPGGGQIRRHSVLEKSDVLLHQRWEFRTADGAVFERQGTTRLYSAEELSAMLRLAGCHPIRALGCLRSSLYREDSERLIWVAER